MWAACVCACGTRKTLWPPPNAAQIDKVPLCLRYIITILCAYYVSAQFGFQTSQRCVHRCKAATEKANHHRLLHHRHLDHHHRLFYSIYVALPQRSAKSRTHQRAHRRCARDVSKPSPQSRYHLQPTPAISTLSSLPDACVRVCVRFVHLHCHPARNMAHRRHSDVSSCVHVDDGALSEHIRAKVEICMKMYLYLWYNIRDGNA